MLGKKGGMKGLTLMETVVSIFIVSLLILTCASLAVTYVNGRRNTMAKQQNVEEMGTVLSQLAKEIRMSNCDTNDSDECSLLSGSNARRNSIKVINNASGGSIEYAFDSDGNLKRNGTTILSGVSGGFYTYPSNPISVSKISSNPDTYSASRVERITISITSDKDGGEMSLQTTVSLRSGYTKQ